LSMWKLSRPSAIGVACVLVAATLSCVKSPPDDPHPRRFVGKYELRVGTNQDVRRKDFRSGVLRLDANGTFQAECIHEGAPTTQDSGTWKVQRNRLYVDPLSDCVGVWPEGSSSRVLTGLVIENTKPLTLVLSADLNVYYEHE